MRNKEYREDQNVFAFINSDNCNTYNDLSEFLYKNNLPFRERWVFYLFGKIKHIDNQTISNIEDKFSNSYGGHIKGEVYYWKEYLNNEYVEKKYIREKLETEGKEVTNYEIHRIYINRGFDFVDCRLEKDIQYDTDKLASEYYEDQMSYDSENWNDFEVCGACQESPCMCSDREKTSTIYDN